MLTWPSLLLDRLKAWDSEHLTGEGPGQMVGCSMEVPGPTGQRRGPDSQGQQKAFSPGPEPTLLQMVTGVTEDTRATSNDTMKGSRRKLRGEGVSEAAPPRAPCLPFRGAHPAGKVKVSSVTSPAKEGQHGLTPQGAEWSAPLGGWPAQ